MSRDIKLLSLPEPLPRFLRWPHVLSGTCGFFVFRIVGACNVAGLNLTLDPDALAPLVRQVVAEVLAQQREAEAQLPGDRLAYSESDAAALLDLEDHVLRDERRRGRIKASAVVGRRIRYLRSDLVEYMLGRRWEGNGK